MGTQSNYEELFEVIIEGEKDNQELLDYIRSIFPEKAQDEEYMEKITTKVYEIYTEVNLNIDIYSIADNYINILREMKVF